jgi:hypothetical protein
MFLADCSPDDGLHELDFRFEVYPGEEFLFAHHGAKLNELLGVCGLPSLGSNFYMVEMAYPLALPDLIRESGPFCDRYGVEPSTAYGRYLRFDGETLTRFFENTTADNELDCTILGTDERELPEEECERFLAAAKGGPGRIPLGGLRSWVHTHDNHFLWFGSRPLGLLRKLIEASLLGFFRQARPHAYTPVPDGLIDLILYKYHTAPLVCFPTTWDDGTNQEVASGVQVDSEGIQALVETAETSWVAYRLNPPKELVGRGLLISYEFQGQSWSYEEWR